MNGRRGKQWVYDEFQERAEKADALANPEKEKCVFCGEKAPFHLSGCYFLVLGGGVTFGKNPGTCQGCNGCFPWHKVSCPVWDLVWGPTVKEVKLEDKGEDE